MNCFLTKDVSLPVAGATVVDLESGTGLVISADIVTAGAIVVTPVDIYENDCSPNYIKWLGKWSTLSPCKHSFLTKIPLFLLNTCTDIIIHVMLKTI